MDSAWTLSGSLMGKTAILRIPQSTRTPHGVLVESAESVQSPYGIYGEQ
jgi:hypothetical protein